MFFDKWFGPAADKKAPPQKFAGAEKALLQRCRGDAEQVARLIAFEMARKPDISRSAAANAALDRWSRDR